MATVAQLMDYLGRMQPGTLVVLDAAEAGELTAEGDFLQMDVALAQLAEQVELD